MVNTTTNAVANIKVQITGYQKEIQSMISFINNNMKQNDISKNLVSGLNDASAALSKLYKQAGSEFVNQKDLTALKEINKEVQNIYGNAIKLANQANSNKWNLFDTSSVESLKQVGNTLKSIDFSQWATSAKQADGATASLRDRIDSIVATASKGDINGFVTDLQNLQKVVNLPNTGTAWSEAWKTLQPLFQQLTTSIDPSIKSIKDLKSALVELGQKGVGKAAEEWDNWIKQLPTSKAAIADIGKSLLTIGQNSYSASQQVTQLVQRFASFTSIVGIINIVRRVIRSAIADVKELDAAMNSIAVVTDYTTQELWGQVEVYSELAQKMGVSIKGVYDVQKLYYQQGRDTADVNILTEETLKLARIAGLEYADATDAMTVALNAFKIEASDSASVVDVYSNLASHAAVSQSELASAMSKVASMASSVGMTLESTSAFLTQIIETTREAPETAGTALKTVLARFGEVKNLVSQGETSGTTDEGEEVDVNKIDTALKSVGIRLTDTDGQMRNLDTVLGELAQKWDSLDTMTKRYIATQAAGSRQQSRFIALMSDSTRLTELLELAENSAGASAKQFEKTQDSLASKINNLKTAWTTFTTSIADSQLIKDAVTLLTWLINSVNKLTDALDVFGSGGLAKITLLIGSLRTLNTLTLKLGPAILKLLNTPTLTVNGDPAALAAQGAASAQAYQTGFIAKLKALQAERDAIELANATKSGAEQGAAAATAKVESTEAIWDIYDAYGDEQALASAVERGTIAGTTEETTKNAIKVAGDKAYGAYSFGQAFKTGFTSGTAAGNGFIGGIVSVLTTTVLGPILATVLAAAIAYGIYKAIEYDKPENIAKRKIEEIDKAIDENKSKIDEYNDEIDALDQKKQLEGITAAEEKRLDWLQKQTEELEAQNKLKQQEKYTESAPIRESTRNKQGEGLVYTDVAGEGRKDWIGESFESNAKALEFYNSELEKYVSTDDIYKKYQEQIAQIKEDITEDLNTNYEPYLDNADSWTDEDLTYYYEQYNLLGDSLVALSNVAPEAYNNLTELGNAGNLNTEAVEKLAEKYPQLQVYLNTLGITAYDLAQEFNDLGIATTTSSNINGWKKAATELKTVKTAIDSITDAVSSLYKNGYVDIDKLSSLVNNDTFSNLDSFEPFINTLATAGKEDLPAVKKGMEDLVSEYLNSTNVLNNLNDETQSFYVNELKNLGVENAEQVVLAKLNTIKAQQKLLTLDTLSAQNTLFNSNKSLTSSLEEMANQYGVTKAQLAQFLIQENLVKQNPVDLSKNIGQFKALAKQIGLTGKQLKLFDDYVEGLKKNSDSGLADYFDQFYDETSKKTAMAREIAKGRWVDTDAILEEISKDIGSTITVTIDTSQFDNTTKTELQKLSQVYNIKKEIAKVDEEIADLEDKRDSLTKYDEILANEKALSEAYKERYAFLKQEETALSNQLTAKKGTMSNDWKAFYDGFDQETGALKLSASYQKILNGDTKEQAKYSVEVLNAFKKWVDEYDDILDQAQDVNDELDESASKAAELWEKWRDGYIDLVNELADALEELDQKEIDDLEEKYDKMKDLDDDYLDSLRENIEARRDARDRETDVEDIAKKQKKLQMLMRDTSGRNAGEIASLQKEIQDAQQDLIDSDTDSLLDAIEKANSDQQDNWDTQIEKMQESIDTAKENGDYIKSAESLIKNNPTAVASKLEKYYKTTGNSYSQAEINKKLDEATSNLAYAKQYLDNLSKSNYVKDQTSYTQNGGQQEQQDNSSPKEITYLDASGKKQTGYVSNGNTYKDKELTTRIETGSIIQHEDGQIFRKTDTGSELLTLDQLTAEQRKALGIQAAKVNSNGVNFRQGPSLSSTVNEKLNTNTAVEVLSEGNGDDKTWSEIRYKGTKGYIRTSFLTKFARGGLVDFTGPAWVDGTSNNPEAFLSATDTKNFTELKQILAQLLSSTRNSTSMQNTTSNVGNCTIYVNVDEIASDYDISDAVDRIKQEMISGGQYRNITLVNRRR